MRSLLGVSQTGELLDAGSVTHGIESSEGQRAALCQSIVVETTRAEVLHAAIQQFENTTNKQNPAHLVDTLHTLLKNGHTLKAGPTLAETLRQYGTLMSFAQCQTGYLARLLDCTDVKQVEAMISTVLSLFSNAHSVREENLLLCLIRDVITLEFDRCKDISTYLRENSAGAKLLSSYARREQGRKALLQVLTPVLQELVGRNDVNLEINPVKVHMQLKSEHHQLSVDDPAVLAICRKRTIQLEQTVEEFLDRIFSHSGMYIGLRIICKTLRDLSLSRFPSNDKLADGLVGGFVFLRFLNPAIVNPASLDAKFGSFPSVMRRNLIMVAKVLQNMSNGVLFGEKEPFMVPLNAFIKRKCGDMSLYFHELCDVPPLVQRLKDNRPLSPCPHPEVVYLTLHNVTTLHKNLQKHRDVLAGSPESCDSDFALLNMLDTLQSDDALVKCDPFLERYVQLRLTPWSSRDDVSLEKESAAAGALRVALLPAVSSTRSWADVHQELQAVVEQGRGMRSVNSRSVREWLESALRMAKKVKCAELQACLRMALHALQDVPRGEVESVLANTISGYEHLLEHGAAHVERVLKEVDQLTEVLANVRQDFRHLQADVNSIQRKYGNATSSPARDSPADAVVSSKPHSTSGSVQLGGGFIGGILKKLLAEIASQLTRHLSELNTTGSHHKFGQGGLSKNEVAKREEEVFLSFPRDFPIYQQYLRKIARLALCDVNSTIHTIVSGLPLAEQGSPSKNSGFSFRSMARMMPTLKASQKRDMDVTDCVVDLVAVDLIFCTLQAAAAHEHGGPLSTDTRLRLTMLAFQHLRPTAARKLRKSLWNALRGRIKDGWAAVVGYMCPNNMDTVLDRFTSSLVYLKSPSVLENVQPCLLGCRYATFELHSVTGLRLLRQFLVNQVQLLKSRMSIPQDVHNPVLLEQLTTVEHVLRSVSFVACVRHQGQDQVQRELSDVFFDLVHVLYTLVVPLCKLDVLRLPAMKLANTLLCHAPSSFFQSAVDEYVSTFLLKGIISDKRSRFSRAQCVLHFLRGGGTRPTETMQCALQEERERDELEEVFGFTGCVLPKAILDLVYKKFLIKKKLKTFMDGDEMSPLLARMVVQLAVHDFRFAASEVLPSLLALKHTGGSATVGEQVLIGLQALFIISDPSFGFGRFLARARGESSLQLMHSTLPDFRGMLMAVIKACEAEVGPAEAGLCSEPLPVTVRGVDELRRVQFRNCTTTLQKGAASRHAREESEAGGATSNTSASPTGKEEGAVASRQENLRDNVKGALTAVGQKTRLLSGQSGLLVEVYCQALRCVPFVMPESILVPSAENCSLDGLFLGKLLCHRNAKLAQSAYYALQLLLVHHPERRTAVFLCLLRMLGDSAFSTPAACTTILSHCADLVRVWVDLLACERELHEGQMEVDFTWRFKAEAAGLVFLCHTDVDVRACAVTLLKRIRQLQNFVLQADKERHTQTLTVASVINLKNDDILQQAMASYAKEMDAFEEAMSSSEEEGGCGGSAADDSSSAPLTPLLPSSSSTSLPSSPRREDEVCELAKRLKTFDECILRKSIGALLPHLVCQLGKTLVALQAFESLREARLLLLKQLGSMCPSQHKESATESASTDVQFRLHWRNVNALYFCIAGIGQQSTVDRVEEEDAGRCSVADAPSFLSAYGVLPKPSDESRLKYLQSPPTGGDKRLCKIHADLGQYLYLLWELLLSEEVWIRAALISACMHVHWESMGRLVKSLHDAYSNLAKKQRKSALEVVSRTLEMIATSGDFVRGLHSSAGDTVRVFREFIVSTQALLWSPSKVGKAKYSDMQITLVCLVGRFTEALWVIGSDEALRPHLWSPSSSFRPPLSPPSSLTPSSPGSSRKRLSALMSTPVGGYAGLSGQHMPMPDSPPPPPPPPPVLVEHPEHSRSESTSSFRLPRTLSPPPRIAHDVDGFEQELRYSLFVWISGYVHDAEMKAAQAGVENVAQSRHYMQRVQRNCWHALQHLLALGPVFPDSGNAARILKENDGALLSMLISAETQGFSCLCSVLTHHLDTLLPMFVDQCYHEKHNAEQFFFDAVSRVFSESQPLITTVFLNCRPHVPSPASLHAALSHHSSRVLLLSLLSMGAPSPDPSNPTTRLRAFLMLQRASAMLVSRQFASELDCMRYAFESTSPHWAMECALRISQQLSAELPSLTPQLFREAFTRLKMHLSENQKEWLVRCVTPWAKNMRLVWRSPALQHVTPSSCPGSLPTSPPSQSPSPPPSQSPSQSPSIPKLSEHVSLDFLLQLFRSTMHGGSHLCNALLHLWQSIADGFYPHNLHSILDFLVKTAAEKGSDQPLCTPTCRSIVFAVFARSPEARQDIVDVLCRYLLSVLFSPSWMSDASQQAHLEACRVLSACQTASSFSFMRPSSAASARVPSSYFPCFHADVAHAQLANMQRQHQEHVQRVRQHLKPCSPEQRPQADSDADLRNTPSPRNRRSTVAPSQTRECVARATAAAALLVDIIGMDAKPAAEFMPVMLVFLVLHIDTQSRVLHQLLLRVLSVCATPQQLEALLQLPSASSTAHSSLADALRCSGVHLIWDRALSRVGPDTNAMDHDHSDADAGGFKRRLRMPIADFVHQLSHVLDHAFVLTRGHTHTTHQEHSRIGGGISRYDLGYEALRWALQSGDAMLANRAFTLYRELMTPVNHSSVRALLSGLLCALQDLEHRQWYSPTTSFSAPGQDSQLRVAALLDTLHAAARYLVRHKQLHLHPSLFWTGVALLNSPWEACAGLYERGLALLQLLPSFSFLFSANSDKGNSVPPPPPRKLAALSSVSIPEGFWSYCGDWAPPFGGVRPLVIKGLLRASTESDSMRILLNLTKIGRGLGGDWILCHLVDARPSRCLVTMLNLLPFLCQRLAQEGGLTHHTIPVRSILDSLAQLGHTFSPTLAAMFASPKPSTDIQQLLDSVCRHLATAFFPQYQQDAVVTLSLMLRSASPHLTSVCLTLANGLLSHAPSPKQCVAKFAPLIVTARDLMNKRDVHARVAQTAADLVSTALSITSAFDHPTLTVDASPTQHIPSLRSTIAALGRIVEVCPSFDT